jgi:hypothetical protein
MKIHGMANMETVTLQVPLAQQHYELLARVAEERDQTATELIEHLATEFLETVQKQAASRQAVEEAQAQYPGEYIAIRHGQVLAHADQATTLLQVIQDKFGLTGADVLLAKVDSPDLRIRHPRLANS